jgi:hypothetical protein
MVDPLCRAPGGGGAGGPLYPGKPPGSVRHPAPDPAGTLGNCVHALPAWRTGAPGRQSATTVDPGFSDSPPGEKRLLPGHPVQLAFLGLWGLAGCPGQHHPHRRQWPGVWLFRLSGRLWPVGKTVEILSGRRPGRVHLWGNALWTEPHAGWSFLAGTLIRSAWRAVGGSKIGKKQIAG